MKVPSHLWRFNVRIEPELRMESKGVEAQSRATGCPFQYFIPERHLQAYLKQRAHNLRHLQAYLKQRAHNLSHKSSPVGHEGTIGPIWTWDRHTYCAKRNVRKDILSNETPSRSQVSNPEESDRMDRKLTVPSSNLNNQGRMKSAVNEDLV